MAGLRGAIAGLLVLLCLAEPTGRAFVATAGPITRAAPAPSDAVILTVTGLDPALHPGGVAHFDLARLKTLGPERIRTSSVWTSGVHDYTGIALTTLARHLKIADATITLHALNDYVVSMPLAEAEAKAPLLAYEMDGIPLPVRGKGPIWVIYPYDAGPQYRTDTSFARSVWQLDRIDVLR